MKKTKWELKKTTKLDLNLPVDEDILSILNARGITKKEDIIKFLKPSLKDLEDPKKLYDIEKARDRIITAIENDEKICIYGDYDVDGITATTILYLGLKELGLKNITYYIPVRDEGYGLNNEALKSIKEDNCDIVITVDCGITSYKEIDYANKLGLTVIITDHHTLLNPIVPNAYAVINPKRLENKYSFNDLAGVGTAFMLLITLFEKYNKYEEAFKYIDIVCLGTIADIVSLTSNNRIIVKYGLEKISYTENLGLKTLCTKIFGDIKNHKFTSSDVGFGICPIFNAAGRLQDAKLVVKLLTSDNIREVEVIIDELFIKNEKRREIQNDIFELAKKELEDSSDLVLVSSSPKYHHGVIGIVAAKLVDTYYKPSIVLEEKIEEKIAVASCRSISNFDITEALKNSADLLVKYGGHKGAAGFTIKIENIEKFKKRINEYAKKILKEEDFTKLISIDKKITINKISYEFYKTLELLKPFGFGNPTPIFLTTNVIVDESKLIGENKNHLSLNFSQKGYTVKNAMWFFNDELKDNIFYDIVYKLNINEYKGRSFVKVYIEDMKESLLTDDKLLFMKSIYDTRFPIKSIFYTNKEVDINDNLSIKTEANRIVIFKNREYISRLDENISQLLIQLNMFYNRKFNIKIESIEKKDALNVVEILIKESFDFVCYKKEPVNIFNKIKKELIDKRNYNTLEKKALASLFHDDKNLLISNKNITGFSFKSEHYLNLLRTFAIFYTNKEDEKPLLLTKDKTLLNDSYLKNFTTNTKSSYLILDRNTYKKEVDLTKFKKIILLDNSIEKYDNFKELHLEIKIKDNVKNISKENIEKYGVDNIYIKQLPNDNKIELKQKYENGEIILADNSIIEII
ncbi:single-stranded-DNA-specific exonuclease RecJ [Oceanivirga miroungae]|uniref:Single-stranded-DNA-specific exonuclease RecJ n=1 Tax=Oceanivirga miroungae TaxID=1130046 RepID=A0A6I8MD73_9FUSO|nr:single-stranded-DNA-specific exonuclease RecJ [Oceanivirga miroungae]VWL85103.1 single-stranded-DNA-specific exonuclease RecJ [Oceanivirga miroungae]